MFVLCGKCCEVFGNTEVDEFDFSVSRYHNIAGVYIAVDISCIMQGHKSAQQLAYDDGGKFIGIGFIEGIEFFGIGYLFPICCGDHSLEQVGECHTNEQFADDVIMAKRLAGGLHSFFGGEESHHLNEIVALDLNIGFTACALYD